MGWCLGNYITWEKLGRHFSFMLYFSMYYCMSGIGEKLMNCQSCGTQLPTGAAACPQCGAKTPYYYSNSGASPYGPTVVAPPGSYNTPNTPSIPPPSTSYGANGYNVPPPPPY